LNCRKVTHLLSAYMDLELPGVETLQIRDHLRRCSECADEFEQLLGMKRMLGKLKIQAPVHADLAADILQNIRIDCSLRTERAPASRLRNVSHIMRANIMSAPTLGIGIGIAGLMLLFYAQSSSNHQLTVVGEWNHATPSAHELTTGLRYGNTDSFVSSVRSTDGSSVSESPANYSYRYDLSNYFPSNTHRSGVQTVDWLIR